MNASAGPNGGDQLTGTWRCAMSATELKSGAADQSGRSSLVGNARLGWDTILQLPVLGIPTWMLHIMEHSCLERLAGVAPGTYRQRPDETYLAAQRAIGTCMQDQYLAMNPLTMGDQGYDPASGLLPTSFVSNTVTLDGMELASPEDVVEHLERFVFPRITKDIAAFDEDRRVASIVESEARAQRRCGPDILKTGYGFVSFPKLAYETYGYELYFSAYALYPDVIERHFALQADYALLNNRAAARAYGVAGLPPLYRLDHDMADSRGTLVNIRTLDRLWFPHFSRCLEPLLRTDVRLIWHCDGNLVQMVPRLLQVGIRGFQGFQYEDGMDYEKICAMKSRDGADLLILAGASVTRTLPFGSPQDVKRELDWLVQSGPRSGLFLGASSSIVPGTPWENLSTLIEGMQYYRERGRA